MPSRKISAEAYLGHLKMNYSLDEKPKRHSTARDQTDLLIFSMVEDGWYLQRNSVQD